MGALILTGTRQFIHHKAIFMAVYENLYDFAQLRASNMQTWHIKTLLTLAVSFAKPFMVFDCLYVNAVP